MNRPIIIDMILVVLTGAVIAICMMVPALVVAVLIKYLLQ